MTTGFKERKDKKFKLIIKIKYMEGFLTPSLASQKSLPIGSKIYLADFDGLVVEHSEDSFKLLDVVSMPLEQACVLVDLVRVFVFVLFLFCCLQNFDLGFKLKNNNV